MNMDANRRQPVVVEEETPHEFYSSLIGSKSRALTSRNNAMADKNRRHSTFSQQQSSLPVVQSDEIGPPVTDAAFNKAYRRVLEDPPKLSSLSLDQSNRGFRILSQMGWKEEDGGLGKRRQGTLVPIKTRLKNDKRGLGVGKKKEERVTHQPHQRASVEEKETKAQRRRRKKAEREEEQHRQKRARMLLRTDVTDEYEKLYMSLHGG